MSNPGLPYWGDADDLARIVDLQPGGVDTWTAPVHLNAPRNVVEGSQMLAQAVVAAGKQVPDKRVISAQATFCRVARFDLPLHFRTEVLQSGRTFATLSVRAEQEDKLRSAALVLMDSGAPDFITSQVAMPDLPGPDACPEYDYGMPGRDFRFVNGNYAPTQDRIGPPELHAWVRFAKAPATPLMHQALMTQCVGHMTIGAALLPHEGMKEAETHVTISSGIMAISIAYHGDPDVSDWLLYTNPAIFAGRGLVQGEGHVFSGNGKLLASYTVQGMVRPFDRVVTEIGVPDNRLM